MSPFRGSWSYRLDRIDRRLLDAETPAAGSVQASDRSRLGSCVQACQRGPDLERGGTLRHLLLYRAGWAAAGAVVRLPMTHRTRPIHPHPWGNETARRACRGCPPGRTRAMFRRMAVFGASASRRRCAQSLAGYAAFTAKVEAEKVEIGHVDPVVGTLSEDPDLHQVVYETFRAFRRGTDVSVRS